MNESLDRIARCGFNSDGKPVVWKFLGCPRIRTTPVKTYYGAWSYFPRADIFEDGQWKSMDEGPNRSVINRSQLPGFHPGHICGMYCDGQDGYSSKCNEEKRKGPPVMSPLQRFIEGVEDND